MNKIKYTRISPENCVFLFCDLQENEKLLESIYGIDDIVATSDFMSKLANILNIPSVLSEHNKRIFGSILKIIDENLKNEKNLCFKYEKIQFSMITEEAKTHLLELKKYRQKIVLLGIETHICILQTVIDLIDLEFEVYVLADGVSSRKEIDRNTALKRISELGGIFITSEAIAFEMIKDYKHQSFKEILNLIKKNRNNTLKN